MSEQFLMPVKVVTGRDCLKNSSDYFKEYGKRVFIITGYSSADKNGSMDDVKYALNKCDIQYETYRGIDPNPTVEQVRDVAKLAKSFKADFVIAIGGGSVIDAAKAVIVLTNNDVSDDELFSLRTFRNVLPLVAVPTTAGTGSEVTQYSIITNVKKETKSFLVSEEIFPKISFMDGKYMKDLPRHITVNTAIDALSHAVEAYLAVRSTDLGRKFALESIKEIIPFLNKLKLGKPLTLEDRDSILNGAMLAGIVIAQSGTTAVHAVGYSLTYFKGLDHGHANGLLMPEYFDFLYKSRSKDIDTLLEGMGYKTLDEFRGLIDSLLTGINLSSDEVEKFSSIAIEAGNITNTKPKPTVDILKDMLIGATKIGGRNE